MTLSISDVERDTGLSKDTLRVWERRYGFPQPQRDALGERVYSLEQLQRLRLIKRLMDAGYRPGRLVTSSMAELLALSQAGASSAATPRGAAQPLPWSQELDAFMALIRAHDAAGLRQALAVAQARHGLSIFVTEVVAPLARKVGQAWAHGELRIFEEHLFTECAQGALHSALSSLSPAPRQPRVLLATPPGEPHALGLLMAHTLLALQGCTCLSLGPRVPLDDLAAAAAAWRADIVALSISGCFKPQPVQHLLEQLRSELPAGVTLWVGGEASSLSRQQIPGVVRLAALEAIPDELARWRAS